jgi:hypothetical protein
VIYSAELNAWESHPPPDIVYMTYLIHSLISFGGTASCNGQL